MAAAQAASTSGVGSYAAINGLRLYYEVHGTGRPLVLIPGGLMTIAQMGAIVPSLAETRQVIALEPQAHGHTADVDRPLTYEQLADDTAALIAHLDLGRADVLGFSVGAGVALQVAVRHPGRVRKLVVLSGTFRGDGEYPEMRAFAATFAPEMPMLAALREAYIAAAGTADGWPALVARVRRLVGEEYDWSEAVRGIQVPALIAVGDADTLPPAHAVELFGLLGGGTAASAMGRPGRAQLAVLPGTTHFNILQRPELLPMLTRFLDAPMPGA